ncbi:MAG: HupE/UreJ family protein [Chthoniobacterales bacterium]|nr:HupE/UreJ family protein [Chthoniobacterales bacterium]
MKHPAFWQAWRRFVGATTAVLWLIGTPASAHTLPLSHVELRVVDAGIDATIDAPAIDVAHDLPEVTSDILLTSTGIDQQKEIVAAILSSRLILEADGERLTAELLGMEPVADQKDIRLRLRFAWTKPPENLRVNCRLFPYDPRHKTFLDIYRSNRLERQVIFDENSGRLDYDLGTQQGTLAVIRQFLFEGVHHIFIGPDHILFIIGLLLLGGTLKQLLKIVSAFTVAHSITLALATFDVLNPPARVIEPAIALSIVFVGVHSLLASREKRDWRLIFAFCFGFIHGFGFANVLREMNLPRSALGWSLFSFNLGVEIGQAFIVFTVAPLLAFVHRQNALLGRRVVTVSSVCVVLAGAFWFVQRVV